MSRLIRAAGPAVLLTVLFAAGGVSAAGNGQDDLDKAEEARITATTMADLGEVIRLAESALKKGLDQPNAEFAKRLLASALFQRAQVVMEQIRHSVTTLDQLRQQRQAALADLDKAVKLDPKQPDAYLLMAELNMLPGGAVKEVREALDKALGLGIGDPAVRAKALVLRGSLQEQPEKKLADFNEAVKLVPDDADTIRARGEALAQLDKPGLALADLDKAIQLKPGDASAYEDKAKLLDKLKKYDQALAVLEKVQQLRPDSVEPWLERAVIHSHQHKPDAALDDLDRALAVQPDNVAVLLLRAGVHQEKGDKKEALADADKAIGLRPSLPMAIRTRALLLADDGRLDEAAGELEKLLQFDPNDTLTRLQLGVLQTAREPAKAIETFSAVLAAEPDQWQAFRGRGDAYLNLGRQAEAVADYEKALALQPKDHGILNNFAWVLATSPDAKLRDGRRAVRLAAAACEATGYKLAYVLSTLAAAYAEAGDFQSAVKWSAKAIQIGDRQHGGSLKKELESYKAHKPWRELLSDGKPQAMKAEERK